MLEHNIQARLQMNQSIYEQFEVDSGKNLFILVCLENKPSSSFKFRIDY